MTIGSYVIMEAMSWTEFRQANYSRSHGLVRPVAELRPLPRRALDASTLLERWRCLPCIDPVRLRSDIDDVIDPSL